MPLPKRRHSKTRGRKRRTHYKLAAPTRSLCPQCREVKLPHRVGPHCGYYKGRERVAVEGDELPALAGAGVRGEAVGRLEVDTSELETHTDLESRLLRGESS